MANQVAGTNIQIDLTLQDDAGDPQDFTLANKLTFRLTRAYSVPGVVVRDNDTIGGISFVNSPGADGLVTVLMDATLTEDLQGDYVHEIKADYGSNQEKTWQLGAIVFSESSVGAD